MLVIVLFKCFVVVMVGAFCFMVVVCFDFVVWVVLGCGLLCGFSYGDLRFFARMFICVLYVCFVVTLLLRVLYCYICCLLVFFWLCGDAVVFVLGGVLFSLGGFVYVCVWVCCYFMLVTLLACWFELGWFCLINSVVIEFVMVYLSFVLILLCCFIVVWLAVWFVFGYGFVLWL